MCLYVCMRVLACFFLVYHTILVFSSILEEWVIALASEAIKVPVPSGPNVSLALIRRLSEMHLVDETRSATPSRLVTKMRKTKSENVSSSDFHRKKRQKVRILLPSGTERISGLTQSWVLPSPVKRSPEPTYSSLIIHVYPDSIPGTGT